MLLGLSSSLTMAGAGPSRPPDWKATSSPAPPPKFGRNSFLALHDVWNNIDAVQPDQPTTVESDRAIYREKFGSAEIAALTQVWANLDSDTVDPWYRVNFSDREVAVRKFSDDTRRVALIPRCRPRILRRGASETRSALPVPSLPAGFVTVPGVEDSEELLITVKKSLSKVLFADHAERRKSVTFPLIKLPPPPVEPPLAQLVRPAAAPDSDDESLSSVSLPPPAEETSLDLAEFRQIINTMSEKHAEKARAESETARDSSYCRSVSGILDTDIAPSMLLDDQKPSNLEEIFPSLV